MTSWGKLGVASGASDWYISVASAARGALLRARCARLAAPLSGLEATSRLALWLERGTIRVLNLASGSKNQKLSSEQVVHARAQRWGHSFPNEGWNGLVMNEKQGFAWDPVLQFGACGDFASGPGVEQAWVSGRNAGNAIVATLAARETGE